MIKQKIFNRRTCAFLIVALLLFEFTVGLFVIRASATGEEEPTIEYTNAYNDLRADKNFNPDNYPALPTSDENYYTLEVITVAESENGELFVYVYQPSGSNGNLRATSINISTAVRTKNVFVNYGLTYLNSYGVYYKYKVNELVVSSASERHYEISSVFRAWNEDYGDEDPGADNTVSEVSFPVGKQFKFVTSEDGTTSATMEDVEYIKIENKFVGYIRYHGDTLYPDYIQDSSTDAHFVAFSTDRKIDELLEADVYYKAQVYHAYKAGYSFSSDPWSDVYEQYKYLDYEQEAECEVSDGSIFTQSEHIWKRIQTTEEFMASGKTPYMFPGFDTTSDVVFTEEATAALAKTDWVLSFVETNYNWYVHTDLINGSNGDYDYYYVRVGDVSILRLKYVTNGITYDLGVVDNKQTGSEDPAGESMEQEWWQRIMMLLCLILVVVVLLFLSGPLSLFGRIIWDGFKFILSILFWVLTLPFKLIGSLFFRRR